VVSNRPQPNVSTIYVKQLAVWQRNYYEHVIRDEGPLRRIREYIVNNPATWEFDRENPMAANPEVKDAWLG
jgi:REP element-mobilizing transposase RayT